MDLPDSELLVTRVFPCLSIQRLASLTSVSRAVAALALDDRAWHPFLRDAGVTERGFRECSDHHRSLKSLFLHWHRIHEVLEYEVIRARSNVFSASLEFDNQWQRPVWSLIGMGTLQFPLQMEFAAECYTSHKVDTGTPEKIVLLRCWEAGATLDTMTGSGLMVPAAHMVGMHLPVDDLLSIGEHVGLSLDERLMEGGEEIEMDVMEVINFTINGEPIEQQCQYDLSCIAGSVITSTRTCNSWDEPNDGAHGSWELLNDGLVIPADPGVVAFDILRNSKAFRSA